MPGARSVARWEVAETTGAVVVIDVIRAFSTAAYAFGSGAEEICLVDTVEDASAFKTAHPDTLAMGEAQRTFALGPAHCDPADIELASRVDAFPFAMGVVRTDLGLGMERRE